MAPSSSSAAVLLVAVVLLLLGMGCPGEAAPACKDCAPQCNSTCSAANFDGAGPCGADCIPSSGCSGCQGYYRSKCTFGCLDACKAQAKAHTSDANYCENLCKGNCSNQSFLCSTLCGESPACTACKVNYSHGCKSCCTAYCKCHCV